VGSALEMLYRVLGRCFVMCVANPPKHASPYFNVDVFLVGFFPESFIRDDSRPPNSTDVY
jgi:hypothetical protein